MYNVFSVSYDLKGPAEDYTDLFAALKASKRWWHYLKSTWLVVADESANDLWLRLEPHLNEHDRLLIIAVTGDSQGLLPTKAWEWIARNIDSKQNALK